MPGGKLMFYWNLLLILLLLYSCSYVPVEVAFFDFRRESSDYKVDKAINITVDILFFIDIIINFLHAYEIHGNSFETKLS
jgi:maltodextrin utilization protein YvdJ